MLLGHFEMVREGTTRCVDCGKEVPTGIINLAQHAAECFDKDDYEKMKADPKKWLEEAWERVKSEINSMTVIKHAPRR